MRATYLWLGARLRELLARDCRVGCLRERAGSDGHSIPIEPRFDSLDAQGDVDAIRDVALLARECRAFSQFDPALSFGDRLRLVEKRTTDELADTVMRRRIRALHSILLDELDALAMNDSISPQRRGKEFEKWFAGVFDVSQLRYTLDIRNEWEQIDFTVWLGSLFAIGEARWLKEPVDVPQVRDFFGKLMDRPPFVVGGPFLHRRLYRACPRLG